MPVRSGRKRIVVLGGGCGGLVTASKLGHELGRDHDVVLVDRRADHVFMPAFLYVMVGDRTPQDIQRKLARLRKRHVRVVQGEIQRIDPVRQEVLLDSTSIPYDYLVVSLGLDTVPDRIPGFAEGAQHAWELDAVVRLRHALETFQGGRVVVGVPLGPYRCPPAPYEAQWMLDAYFDRRGIRDRVTISAFTPDPEPAGEASFPAVWMDRQSKSRRVEQHYEFVVRSIDAGNKTVNGLYGYQLKYDLLIMVPPHQPARVLLESGLADTENGIRVDYDTLATKWDNVFAVGDCADLPASKSGGVAHQAADVVAHNLAVAVTGRGQPVPFRLQTL